MLSRRSQSDAVLEPDPQYAVVLLNEEQLGQFMRRPGVRQYVNRGYAVADVHTRYLRLKRQTAAAAALLLLIGAGSFLYFMAPQPAMASMFAWKELPEAPTLDTGASFSVTSPPSTAATARDSPPAASGRSDSPRSPESRRAAASYIRRWSGRMRHSTRPSACSVVSPVRVSPARGFSWMNLFATRPATKSSPPLPRAIPNILLIGAPDRVSLVFELPLEPRQVRERRTDNVLDPRRRPDIDA